VRDLSLGQRDDLYACERHALEHAGDILLVAADAIEGAGTTWKRPHRVREQGRISEAPETAQSW